VLFRSALELLGARESIGSETVGRWMLFISNQGTDDHVIREWTALEPNSSYELLGTVHTPPATIVGGHVLFTLRVDRNGEEVRCAAYEPSKGFRSIVRSLRPGDRVRAVGELRERPRTLNLEKLEVIELHPAPVKVSNPTCSFCGKKMKSVGAGQGYRCRGCHTKAAGPETVLEERELKIGWYEPPVCARRHLAKPLKRMRSY
jgi:tRNA(Ile2)-agmatinylcytidine synthase